MANQLRKLITNLSTVTQPLRDLLQKKNQWTWGPSQQRAFDLVKDELSKTPVLALYDPNRGTTVSADASSYGLGAVIRQKTNGTLRPVAYASRAMTPNEKRYSQNEKEALATTWSLGRFTDYLYGMSFHVETDHKPLVSLLSSKKNLDELSPRIQRFRMRLIHVHDRSCTRKEPCHGRRPGACSSRATTNRGRRAIDGRSNGTSKPGCGCVTGNREVSGRDQS